MKTAAAPPETPRIFADQIDMEGPSPFELIKSPKVMQMPAEPSSAAEPVKEMKRPVLPPAREPGQAPKASAEESQPEKLLIQPRPVKGQASSVITPQPMESDSTPKAKPGERAILPMQRNTSVAANPFETNEGLTSASATIEQLQPEVPAGGASRPTKDCRRATKLPGRKKAVQGELFENMATGPSRPKDIAEWAAALSDHRDRTGSPLEMQAKEPVRSTYNGRRVKFSCPACMQTVSLPRNLAAKKTRCPSCLAAIRAADPRHQRGAYSYDRDISSLIHPENFPLAKPPRPKFLGIPLPEAHSAVIGSAAAMVVAGLSWLGHSALNRENSVLRTIEPAANVTTLETADVAAGTALAPLAGTMEPEQMKEQAIVLVRQFLLAEGVAGKAIYVRDAERVEKLMAAHFDKHGGAQSVNAESLLCDAIAYYTSSDLPQPMTTVAAKLTNGDEVAFRVEFLAGGPKIEWESSVAYAPKTWQEILSEGPGEEPNMVRIAACPGRFYDQQFSSDSEHLCVDLRDPLTLERLGWGYIPAESEDAARLRVFLQGSTSRQPQYVTLEVRPVENSAKTAQVEIVRFIKGGFRHDEAAALADNTGGPSF